MNEPAPAPVMSAERWLRLQALFSAALDCDASRRSDLLNLQCADDADLRREVESLLDSHERVGLVDDLAEKITAPAELRIRLATLDWQGKRVAQYTVLEALGAGAMGRIYKARDERLGRYVALKFLPAHLGAEPNAKRRFLLEARAAAALDHPNICTIHEIGATNDGQPFIAMALYDGETLQTRLTRGPLGLGDVVSITLQIANGLAKAHERGVIHRDVKPSNIMLLADGTAKILDFGIARIEDVPAIARDDTALGTVAYMSPEQARGDVVDLRTDVWSLGVVLYEMLAGTRPFRADNTLALRHKLLTTEPQSVGTLRTGLPAAVGSLLRKALAKAPSERYASMAQMAEDLAALAPANRGPLGPRSDAIASAEHVDDGTLSTSGERRRAAVLVSILPDYVSLIEQLPPQTLEELTARLQGLAAEVAHRHGGLVNQASGEEVVCIFGIPVAHEDDDLRAVRAAVELHARVRELDQNGGGEWPVALRLQSGVHSGRLVARRVAEGRYDVKGPAAQVAARVAALAPRDVILVSAECERLIAPFMDTAPYESFVLNADTAPITTHRIVGESGLQTRLEAAERNGLTPYTGRQAELASLEALFAQARAGRGQIAFVVGEAGVGKSRLLHEFRARIRDTAARVLPARCNSYGGLSPYLPFVEILKAGLGLQEDARPFNVEEVAARIRAIDPSLEPFVPLYLHALAIAADAYPLPGHFRGDLLQSAVPEALAAILARLVADGPRVFLLEDWHWSDAGSRETLRRLAEIVDSQALLVVVTTRPDERGLPEVIGSAARLDLAPFDFDNSVLIMMRVLRVQHVSDDLAHRLFERTGGNLFFLEEVCRALLEQGEVAARDGEGVAAAGIGSLRLPDTVQAVIRTRLDGLDRQALALLRVASVVGRDFSLELLTEVLAGSESERMQAIERLTTAGLIQQISALPEPVYRFKHVLTQEVTYDSLLEHQRRSLHELVGYAMERTHSGIDDQAELLAHHFSRAEAWAFAVRYGRRAADRASALSQFADALGTLDRVRDWVMRLRGDDERCDLLADVLLQQERLCETLGQRGRQERIVDELISQLAPRGASERLAQAYLRKGDLATLLRRFDAADRALSTALRICRERNDAAFEHIALRSMGLLRWHEGRHVEALVAMESAIQISRERGNSHALAVDLANRGIILKSMGDYPRALESLDAALAMPAMAQDPATQVYARHMVANVHRSLGNVASALEHLERANAIARSHLLPIQRSFHLMAIAHVLLQQGQIEESLKTYEEAVALSRRARHADGLVQALRALGEVLCGLGRDAEAAPCFEEAAALFGQLEDRAGQVEMWTRRATLLERTDAAAAETAWDEVRALRARLGDRRGELEALEGIARTARQRCTTAAEAIPHVEAALALACTLGERNREAGLLNTLGILEWERGDYPQALRHYEQSLALARDLGKRASEGLALNSIAVTLARLNRYEEARTVLEDSIRLNRETGEQLLEAHALAALGDVWCAVPRFSAARECYEQSLSLRRVLGDRKGEGHLLQRLAGLRGRLIVPQSGTGEVIDA
jgi:serine/threonine protein kinase/tetratricopeptide (TPR) repeat protein